MISETTNTDRAWWALFALGDFVNRTGVHEKEEAIGDLVTNLLHLARLAELDPGAIARRALLAMDAEVREDDEGNPLAVLHSLETMMKSRRQIEFR